MRTQQVRAKQHSGYKLAKDRGLFQIFFKELPRNAGYQQNESKLKNQESYLVCDSVFHTPPSLIFQRKKLI
jgi:hypothetical protein